MRETLTSGSTRGEEVVLLGIASSPTLPENFLAILRKRLWLPA